MKTSVAATLMAFAFIVIACTTQMHGQATTQNEVYAPALFEDLHFRMVGPTRGGAAAAEEKLAELHAKFVTAEGTYQTPMLIQQIGYLNGMTSRADQRPGNHAYTRLTQLRERLAGYAAELQAILDTDMPAPNREL